MSNISECYKSNILNPMGNFLPFDSRMRGPVCQESIENTTGIERIYTMPVTTSAPDTMALAKFLFPNTAKCRDLGYVFVTEADTTIKIDKLAYFANEKKYYDMSKK